MSQARARRAVPRADSGMTSYRARATGYVYFYLDRRDSGERNLVKTDQLALDVYWATPNRTKQHIVGLRDESALPNNIRYHMDHLTVVQDEFGDIIRLGDGDEVRDVAHPAAPFSDRTYDFRLADSLSIQLTGRPTPIRVYEIQVRPKRFEEPGFVGSIFVDRETAAVVRMNFTFTPSSYVDRRLDYIRISLDNGLWDGRYWLPHEQRLEIRRQLPELDFPTGGVIRAVLRIGDYRFNEPFDDLFFAGRPVLTFPRGALESFAFDEDLHAELDVEGLASPAELEELRRTALELVGARRLSGLPGVRIRLEDASSFVRYDRAEGVRLGAGVVWSPAPETRLEFDAAYAFARGRPAGAVAAETGLGSLTTRLELFHERMRDIAPTSGVSGVLNTLYATLAETDHLDPYFTSGGSARVTARSEGAWTLSAQMLVERHRTARLAVGSGGENLVHADAETGFRPVRRAESGSLAEVAVRARRTDVRAARAWGTDVSLSLAGWDGDLHLTPHIRAWGTVPLSSSSNAALELATATGIVLGDAPPQRLFLFGGRGTVPGYEYRSLGGDRYWSASAEAAADIVDSWVRGRLLAYAGWVHEGGRQLPADWNTRPTDGVIPALGLGVGLVHDILRIDAVRGLDGGEWQTLIAVHPRLGDFL